MNDCIRHATAADAEEVAGLLGELGYPTAATDVPDRLAQVAANQQGVVLLAERDGRIVGLATVHVIAVLNRPRKVAWLTALVVTQHARGMGIGRVLVAAAEQFARAAGCERLSVTTHEDRAGARAFYPSVGLEETGRRFGKMLTGEPT